MSRCLGALVLLCLLFTGVRSDDRPWIALDKLSSWKSPVGDWIEVGNVELDPANPKKLIWKEGTGILVNGPKGRTRNLVTKDKYGDLEAHLEFLIPKGSNSGAKMHEQYEIQIFDSYGKKSQLSGTDCGGIYPRSELTPRYHHLDNGTPPHVNACKAPGEWQTLDIVFQAPRFDAEGKKIASARFVKVVLNGQVIHENVEQKTPTGAAWQNKELPEAPFFLQADHGPVAFRNVRIRPTK